MLKMNDVIEELKRIILEVLDVEEEDVKADSFLRADLNAESIDFIDISYEIENSFDIEIEFSELLEVASEEEDEEITDMTITTIAKYVMKIVNNKDAVNY